MAILGENLDYTDRDFDALRARLFNLISGVFPTWTARQVANFGNTLVEMYAFTGDILSKYQDNQARESRWSQATQRKNLIAMAKLIGFEPATATASQVDVTLSLSAAAAADVRVPAGTVVRTQEVADPVEFRTLADAVIPQGNTELTGVSAENAETQEDVFSSSGTPNLELTLSATPYLDGTLSIIAGNGVFTEVDSFLDSDDTDKHFTVTVDQNDRATARFGNGTNGVIPTGTITGSYKTGGGAAGEVEAETVVVIEGTFTDDLGNPVQLSVTNPAGSTPATNRQTVEQIRQLGPLSLRTLNRTVSREDYENNAQKLAQVSRALMLTSNEDSSVLENEGFLYILPVGGGSPTEALLDDVEEQVTVTFPNTVTFRLNVRGPDFLTVNVQATVFLDKGVSGATVKSRVKTNLEDFFAPENDDGTPNTRIDFGARFRETTGDPEGKLPLSDIFNAVRDTEGIRKIGDQVSEFTLNGEHADLDVALKEFPVLGTVTLIDGATGSAL